MMSYMGLVPREFSSGEKQLRGHITKAGASRARALLVQAAQTMMRVKKPQTEALCKWAESIAQRRGKRIAVVALARRLSGIMWAMLRDGTEYTQRSVSSPVQRVTESTQRRQARSVRTQREGQAA